MSDYDSKISPSEFLAELKAKGGSPSAPTDTANLIDDLDFSDLN